MQVLWNGSDELQGEPYCENWRDVALNDAKPANIRWLYKKGGNTVARSSATKSVADRSQIDMEDLKNDIANAIDGDVNDSNSSKVALDSF
jgi:hypothetical protein